MRWVVVAAVLCSMPTWPALAQEPDAAQVVDQVLRSGDGSGPETAYAVPGLLWEYTVLQRLGLRFRRQRGDPATGLDVVTVRDPKADQVREVWFRARVPDKAEHAELDRTVRAVVTSGDGASPETAFVVGGRIRMEYQILRMMGMEPQVQALVTIRGCSFDRQSARDLDTQEVRSVFFKLGRPNFDYRGDCVLEPAR